jgi:hypothetical protein
LVAQWAAVDGFGRATLALAFTPALVLVLAGSGGLATGSLSRTITGGSLTLFNTSLSGAADAGGATGSIAPVALASAGADVGLLIAESSKSGTGSVSMMPAADGGAGAATVVFDASVSMASRETTGAGSSEGCKGISGNMASGGCPAGAAATSGPNRETGLGKTVSGGGL